MSKNSTYIICSAVKWKGVVVGGRRHGDCFEAIRSLISKKEFDSIKKEEFVCGFIDNWGEFHTRAEGWVIADQAGQVKFGKGTQDPKETPILISEHLFDDKDEI